MLWLPESDGLVMHHSTSQSFLNINAKSTFECLLALGVVSARMHVVLGGSFSSLINETGPYRDLPSHK